MMYILKQLLNSYNYYYHEIKDPRSEHFLLLETPPFLMASVMACYVLMVKYGPELMKSRKAFELKTVLMVYNFVQVILNVSLGVAGVYNSIVLRPFNFECHLVDWSTTAGALLEMRLVYCYFLLKMLDLLDTVFIILKKNNSQLSFLHCYHHFFMAVGVYGSVNWAPGGHLAVLGIINTFVHGVMYFYFFLTTFKPELKKSFRWKKNITQIQMFQFSTLIIHFLRGALAKNCDFPKFWMWLLITQNTFMLTLFTDFYRKTYLKKKSH